MAKPKLPTGSRPRPFGGKSGRSGAKGSEPVRSDSAQSDQASSTIDHAPRKPLQSEGVERGGPSLGGPARAGRQGIALQVLADPTARRTFSRVYSGQAARPWRR